MKTINIGVNSFELEETRASFLQKYLDKIKNYVEKNNLDSDLINDIEDRISEKFISILETNESISQKNVITTVNEIGEAEDIFKDLIKIETSETTKKVFTRNSKSGVLLGVCEGLGEYFGKKPVVFRILFIISTLLWGIGIWIYLAIALITPDINKDETLKTSFKSNFKKFFNYMLKILIFLTLLSIGITLFFSGIGLIIGGGALQNGLVLNNVDFLGFIPKYIIWLTIINGAICVATGVLLTLKSIGQKGISYLSLGILVAIITILSALSLGNSANIIYKNLNYTLIKTETFNFENTASGKTLDLNINNLGVQYIPILSDLEDHYNEATQVTVKKSTNNKIKVELITSITTSDETKAEEIYKKIEPISVKLEDNILNISKSKTQTYKEVVPLVFTNREIVIYLPTTVSLDTKLIESYKFYLRGISFSDEMQKVGIDRPISCEGQILKYSTQKNSFYCNNEALILQEKENQKNNTTEVQENE